MRPQVLSFLLVAVTTTAWLRTREDKRIRWWLVPLTWLWAMLHGMWPIGIGIGVVAVVGMALDRDLPRRDLGRAALVPLLSAVAAALTPLGPALYGGVLGVGDRSQFFSEWGAPDYTSFSCIVLGLMLAITARADAAARRAHLRRHRALPGRRGLRRLVVAHGAGRGDDARSARRRAGARRPHPARDAVGAWSGSWSPAASVATLGVLAVAVPHTSDQPPAQPTWVDPALSSLPPGTKVVNAWDWGGYLMWRYPQLDLLMHGYGDTYTIDELQRITDISDLQPGWDDELRATGCTVAVLRPTGLAYALQHQMHWTVVHRSRGHRGAEGPGRLAHRDELSQATSPLADDGVGDRASSRPSRVSTSRSAASSTSPRATRSATARRPCWSSASTGSPSRSRISRSTRSTRRVSASSVSRAAAGLASAASRPAYAAGCLTFHQRTPPTWLCAPGPIPHQCAPVQ